MKNGQVIKSTAPMTAQEELALVNSYSRRELSKEEIYLFTVALCDNDVDRDHERFTVESLFALEKLFVGKTGILDHDPSAKNQKARIISCRVESVEGQTTALGDQLFRLTARAYIRRTEGNAELIEAIESGIVKEVSVGCSIGHTLCSVCHHDMRSPECHHTKGAVYDGEICCGELCEPQDAYEFSFVAIPAQRAAGVIKAVKKEKDMKEILKSLSDGDTLSLSGDQSAALGAYIKSLEEDAACAKAYRDDLQKSLRKRLGDQGLELEYETSRAIIGKLSIAEMKALIKALDKSAAPAKPQLCREREELPTGKNQFTI